MDDAELLEASPLSTFAVNVAYGKYPPTADAFVYAVANDQMDFHLLSVEEAENRSKHLGERYPHVEDYRKVAGDAYLSTIEILLRVLLPNLFSGNMKQRGDYWLVPQRITWN